MDMNVSGQFMPSDVPIQAIWDDEDDSEVYLESTAAKDDIAKEFDRLFGIKFLFLQNTLDPHRFQLRLIILDVSSVIEGYEEPELMVLDGSFMRVIGNANLINSPDLLRLRVSIHVEGVLQRDTAFRNLDWDLGVVAICLLRETIQAYISHILEVSPGQLVTGLRCFRFLHLMDTMYDTLARRHTERPNSAAYLLAVRAAFLRELLEKHSMAMDEIPELLPMAAVVPREIYHSMLPVAPYTADDLGGRSDRWVVIQT